MKRPDITGKQVARYVLLPGIIPQLRELFASGFGFIAVCMAQIYGAVRLLPPGHPYLLPANAGRFGVRHVMTAAASRLSYKREHIDQVIVFYLMLGGLVILIMQAALLVFGPVFTHAAHAFSFTYATPSNFEGFVGTPDNTASATSTSTNGTAASDDVAFVLLDRVFGVPNFFTTIGGQSTCVALDQPCFTQFNSQNNAEGNFPWAFHDALHGMLSFYSIGLLVIGVLIFCYYIFAVAAETAQTGTPFGRRFNHVWAPIRMVAALGLLIPLPIQSATGNGNTISGLNSAQYILLYAAKWGSGFATNGWNTFTNELIDSTLGGDQSSLVAAPTAPDVTKLMEFMLAAETCRAAYETKADPKQIVRAYVVKNSADAASREEIDNSYTYDQARTFYGQQDISIVFGSCIADNGGTGTVDCDEGSAGKEVYYQDKGYVKPLCGELELPITGAINSATNPGAYAIEEGYFNLVRDAWLGSKGGDDGDTTTEDGYSAATTDVCGDTSPGTYKTWLRHWGYCFVEQSKVDPDGPHDVEAPDQNDLENLLNGGAAPGVTPTTGYQFDVQQIVDQGVITERSADEWAFTLQNLGWAGAGVWYNKIAQMNGAIINAANSLPRIKHYPRVMEATAEQTAKNNKQVEPRKAFNPEVANGDIQVQGAEIPAAKANEFSKIFYKSYAVWDGMYPVPDKGNSLDSIISAIFGENALFWIHKSCDSSSTTCAANTNVTPIALLAGLGDTLINATVVAMGLSGAATLLDVLSDKTGTFSRFAGSLASSIGLMLLTTGFILYYVVPFLPFLYFFFAVGSWIKGIFEAMVGVPLWALAHIRIDGEGLAGQAAIGGYFMILEIFLRPILIIFGMLASITIFSAQVFVLNDIWDLVTSNLSGFDHTNASTSGAGSVQWLRNKMDMLAFTILYAFVVYMLGTSSFKLILLLPKGIMRWMGSNVGAFSDQEDDPARGLIGRIQEGGGAASNIVGSGLQNVGGGAKGVKQIISGKPGGAG